MYALNPKLGASSWKRRLGFTLIEVLIAIGMLVWLIVAIVQGPVAQSRLNAARVQSQNNLRQLGIGCHGYHDVMKHLPTNGVRDKWGTPVDPYSGSWLYQILPYIEQEPLYKNPKGIGESQPVSLTMCPARSRPGFAKGGAYTGPVGDYALSCWLNSGFGGAGNARIDATPIKMRLVSIADGTSNTFMLGQLSVRSTDYAATDGAEWRESFMVGGRGGSGRAGTKHFRDAPDVAFANNWGGPFPKGTLFVMGDISVRQIPYSADLTPGLRQDDGRLAPDDPDAPPMPFRAKKADFPDF